MDPRLFEAVKLNDKLTFERLVQENRSILLQQECQNSWNTVLHLASGMGHTELARKIVELCPDLVAMENALGEIPLHEASRNGNADTAKLLLEINPWIASALNHENQSAFSIACNEGKLDVVRLLLDEHWLMDIEEARMTMHELISVEYTQIVREILEARPLFAMKTDEDGCVALHYACERKQYEMTRLLLKFAPYSANKFNKNGYTPLHFAVMNGETAILMDFMSLAPTSYNFLTRFNEETVFHLAAKFGKYQSFVLMAEVSINAAIRFDLVLKADKFGNTVLHLAVSAGCYHLAEYILKATNIDVKRRNHQGHTALDLVNQARVCSESKYIRRLLVKSGRPETSLGADIFIKPEEINGNESEQSSSERNEFSSTTMNLKDKRPRKELREHHRGRRNRRYKNHREALQNARNTIILVAILIATVSFTVGLSPPGGVYQGEGGVMEGKSIAGKQMAFKIFAICNSIALFTSLCIVVILVSIIPFQRKELMKLMVITHKVMWISVSFMATAFVAAGWVIMPHDQEIWMFETITAIGAGSMATVFIYLGVHLVKHWLRKLKYKKERGNKRKIFAVPVNSIKPPRRIGEIHPRSHIKSRSESSNSDIENAKSLGCHTY